MRGRWSKDNGVGDEGREIRERASQKRKETMKKMNVFRDLYKFEYMKNNIKKTKYINKGEKLLRHTQMIKKVRNSDDDHR